MHVRLAINMFIVTSNLNLIWFNQFYLQPDYSVELLPWYLDSTGFYHLLAPARRCGSLVWDSEGVCERTDSIVEDLFEAVDGDTDSEAAPRRRKDKKRKRKSSSDSSEDTEDKDEESGSDSESEKVGLDY